MGTDTDKIQNHYHNLRQTTDHKMRGFMVFVLAIFCLTLLTIDTEACMEQWDRRRRRDVRMVRKTRSADHVEEKVLNLKNEQQAATRVKREIVDETMKLNKE